MALETLTYTNPLTGASITFGDSSLPFVTFKGLTGGGLPPVDNFVVDTAYQPGAQFVRTKKKPTVLTAKLVILGDDSQPDPRQSLWNQIDLILGVLNPEITLAGSLVKQTSDGVQRKLQSCQYVGGFEVQDRADMRARVELDLIFEAYDPTWYSVASHSQAVGASSDPFGFSVPIAVPLTINGQAKGVGTVQNAGNIRSKPVFTFTGPCQNFSILNQTTGESFSITQVLNTGDTLVVDTVVGSITFIPSGGAATPLYSAFAGNKQWVSLAPGLNTVQFFRDVAGNNQCSIAWSDTWNHG